MKAQILKIAGVKNEKEFYKKFPTEAAFMKKHGKQLKKAQVGTLIGEQKESLSFKPITYDNLAANAKASVYGISPEEQARQEALNVARSAGSQQQNALGGLADVLGSIDPEMIAQLVGGAAKNGKMLKKAQKGLNQGFFSDTTSTYGYDSKASDPFSKAVEGAGKSPFDWKGTLQKAAPQLAAQAGPIIGAIQDYKDNERNTANARKYGKVSDITLQAASTRPEQSKRRYVRPEDQLMENFKPLGTGTNYLAAANGTMIGGNPTEIQNMYTTPNTMYTDLAFEPLNDSHKVKNFKKGGKVKKAVGGVTLDSFSGQGGSLGGMLGSKLGGGSGQGGPGSTIGSAIGGIAGSFIPIPGVGTFLGSTVGGLLGGLFDAKGQNEAKKAQDKLDQNLQAAAFQSGTQNLQTQNKAFMEDGGWVSNDWQPQVITTFGEHKVKDLLKPPHDADMLRAGGHLKEYTPPSAAAMYTGRDLPYQMEDGGQMAMGGDLQVLDGGYAETMSYNPYMPGTGETIMFKGRSHDDGGIPIQYGQNGVEVEGGEPMFQMENGGEMNSRSTSGLVAGNLIIPDYGVNEIGDPKAKGKKFKHYIADLSKQEAKINKSVEKGVELVNTNDTGNEFDQLAFNSGKAMMMGGDLKLKTIAERKLDAAAVQNAILDTAEEFGLESDALAKGNMKQAKFGGKFEKAQFGNFLGSKTPIGRVLDEISEKFRSKEDPDFKGWDQINKEQKPAPAKPAAAPAKPAATPAATKPAATTSKSKSTKPKASTVQAAPKDLGDIASLSDFVNKIKFPERKAMAESMGIKDYVGTAEQNAFLFRKTQIGEGAPLERSIQDALIPSRTADIIKSAMDKSIKSGAYKTGTESGGTGFDSDWKKLTALGLASAMGQFRPSDAENLDSSQLAPEMMALASNTLEPVQAQTFQPLLAAPTSFSLQDQLNEITSATRAAEKMAAYNPEAAAMIAAQAYSAKNKVLGEQFRMNQAEQQRVAEQNRNVLNDAQLKNLAIYDTQYQRQEQAKSATKQQALEAMKSIADKVAKNKLENRTLGVMENMYNYRFTKSGQAYNLNNPQLFNFDGALAKNTQTAPEGYEYETILKKKKDSDTGRNGAIVKAIKNL
jgi:hypothetical protein